MYGANPNLNPNETQNPIPQTLKPYTLNPKPLNPKPMAPYTCHPQGGFIQALGLSLDLRPLTPC